MHAMRTAAQLPALPVALLLMLGPSAPVELTAAPLLDDDELTAVSCV